MEEREGGWEEGREGAETERAGHVFPKKKVRKQKEQKKIKKRPFGDENDELQVWIG